MRKFTSLAVVAALTLTLAPTLGLTQTARTPAPNARIALADLNLAVPADAAKFAVRVNVASEQLCHDMARANPAGAFTMAGCKAAARRQALSQLSDHQRQSLRMASRASSVAVAAR
jgi:UrcA family protein